MYRYVDHGRETHCGEYDPELTLEQIRDGYVASLADKCEALRAAVASVAAAGTAAEAVDLAHRMRGSAGVYGFSLLSRTAGQLEDMLEGGERGGPVAEILDTIDELCHLAALEGPTEEYHAPAGESPSSSTPRW
ncbi:MAG: Hpt domain-containing protein [Acidimicrobiia bacterium]